jgi:hypothetical protein
MAGPHFGGGVALLWSASIALIGDSDLTEVILRYAGKPPGGDLPACIGTREMLIMAPDMAS